MNDANQNKKEKTSFDFTSNAMKNIYLKATSAFTDSVNMDISNYGVHLMIFCAYPKQSEISQFEENKPFEMKLIQMNGLLFGLFKVGNINWMDAPYNAHLSQFLTKLPIPADGTGIMLKIMLVDRITGKTCISKDILLSNKISMELMEIAENQLKRPFSPGKEHFMKIIDVYNRYTTKQLVAMAPSTSHFRIG